MAEETGGEEVKSEIIDQKAVTIQTLAEIRMQWRNREKHATESHLNGFKRCAQTLFSHIEQTTPDDERWTYLPDESELTEHSKIGDHLSVTRRLLGFNA